MIYCTLKEYLAQIGASYRRFEGRKPPTMADIARDTGVSYRAITRMANNETFRFDCKMAYKVIQAVRARGYEMQLSDLIAIKEPKAESHIARKEN